MKSLKVAVALVTINLALIPNVAMAKWVHILNSQDGDKLLVGNMWKQGNVVNFWEAIVQPGDDTPIAQLIATDCSSGQFQVQQRMDGVNTSTVKSTIQQAPMGSLYAAAISYACAEAD